MVTSFESKRYEDGKIKADQWVASGGGLDREPPKSDEAFENGYADRLHELRKAEKTKEKNTKG